MKYVFAAVLLLGPVILLACGDDDDVPAALAGVCTEGEDVAGDLISVDEPGNGDDVASPIRVTGEVVPAEGRFWISVVDAEEQRIIDFPGRVADSEDLTPFELEVPFTVFEETPACLWVYLTNAPDPPEAVRIPINLVPPAEDSE